MAEGVGALVLLHRTLGWAWLSQDAGMAMGAQAAFPSSFLRI